MIVHDMYMYMYMTIMQKYYNIIIIHGAMECKHVLLRVPTTPFIQLNDFYTCIIIHYYYRPLDCGVKVIGAHCATEVRVYVMGYIIIFA